MAGEEFGAQQVARELQDRLARFIESRYHIADEPLIHERRALLSESNAISQPPYVETTPTYESGTTYSELGLPYGIGNVLARLAALEPSVGIYPRPYLHQEEALRSFLIDDCDLVIATGTGSGKTETFLLPILSQLLIEASQRPNSFAASGFRALLLYPMNALVSDQISRLRRLFGDTRVREYFSSHFGRATRFGMYTSRTPYPGQRKTDRDRRELKPLVEYYQRIEASADAGDFESRELLTQLRSRGRWPALDLEALTVALEQNRRPREPLPTDAEILSRHEMQRVCPDILVTNYSMLEYMLIRPIERTIFAQTRDWLERDDRNRLILVLDEAHVYRGTSGAEVGYLIRRLYSRLGVSRDRVRCILTSASLGAGETADRSVQEFAASLVAVRDESTIRVIQGRRELRSPGRAATEAETRALAAVDLEAVHDRAERFSDTRRVVTQLSQGLNWTSPVETDTSCQENLRAYLYHQLVGWGPLELLIQETVSEATAFDDLAQSVFVHTKISDARSALAALLELGTWAHDGTRPLLPTRVHLMFRGLPALYACINPRCDVRHFEPGFPGILGRLYTEPRSRCECAPGGRVFELLAHRSCGAAFLRGFGRGVSPTFYWHERGGSLGAQEPLTETTLLISEPHPDQRAKVEPIWLELSTGRVATAPPRDIENYLAAYRPSANDRSGPAAEKTSFGFRDCPACGKRSGGSKILSLATKGDQPFANLVRDQLVLQPATKTSNSRYPNGGRKVLLFSDGRQRAARLARDLPREVEFDSFRQAIALATDRLVQIGDDPTLDKRLYAAFISVCADFDLHFFDQEGQSQQQLLQDIRSYRQWYDGKLETLLEDRDALQLPLRYRQALLRQLSDPFHSLYAVACAVIRPTSRALKQISRELGPIASKFPGATLDRVASVWTQSHLEEGRFDSELNRMMRYAVLEYFREAAMNSEVRSVEKLAREVLSLSESEISILRQTLYEILTQADARGDRYLNPARLVIDLALDRPWVYCSACRQLMDGPVFDRCVHCGRTHLVALSSSHPKIASLTDYFREPMRRVLLGERPVHVTAEEHTAQLSHRDRGIVYATTEEYELRFQDVWLGEQKPPVDVLSCTTTMEVGVDIGTLNAIGLRNVPPQRENYQQRAGRAGRRGTAVSTVMTYCQDGPHDSYYFYRPEGIISGPPRQPRVHIGNRRLARRHVNAYLLQTFFHSRFDALSAEEQAQLSRDGSLFSALGMSRSFFSDEGPLSLAAFRLWVEALQREGVGSFGACDPDWLPNQLFVSSDLSDAPALRTEKLGFLIAAARDLISRLNDLAQDLPELGQAVDGDEDRAVQGKLLDLLFDEGVLPSYAFPTELCSFSVFDRVGGRVQIKERPQQAKEKALSEYAPGRLLVVNKETYRVGGIFVEGRKSASPARELFSTELLHYVHCPSCTYIRLGRPPGATERCPVCSQALTSQEMLDPPGFSPEKGEALLERDTDQEFSYATGAQLPLPVTTDEIVWIKESGVRLRHATRMDQELVIVNQGPDQEGFAVCELCGAAWPSKSAQKRSEHDRPFLIEPGILDREHARRYCTGSVRAPLYLGHRFRSDLLLLRLDLVDPLSAEPRDPWLHDSLRTLAESLAIAASIELDVDPGEISAGYRLIPLDGEADPSFPGLRADIFLYDTASGGAGYSLEAGESLSAVLDRTLDLLENCPKACDRSCVGCLRHYGNRFWHDNLDRHLAAGLLRFVRSGNSPIPNSPAIQARQLSGLKRYLELEGWSCFSLLDRPGQAAPLTAIPPSNSKYESNSFSIWSWPALLDPISALKSGAPFQHRPSVVLRDYVVTRDLPTAFEQLSSRAKRSN